MNIKIQALKFDASEKLTAHIEKKAAKLERFYNNAIDVEVTLKVVKPETNNNKEAQITLLAPNVKLFASKLGDSFEQAVDEALFAIEKQIEKQKEKQ